MTKMAKSIRLSVYFLVVIALALLDIWFDFKHGIPARHLLFEVFIFFLGLVGFNYFSSMAYKIHREKLNQLQSLQKDISDRNSELEILDRKVKSYREEFRQEIADTFSKWGFTRSEADVAGLLLKGMSLKEVAEARKSNERTVRSQCSSIYRKSKLGNRSQLSSYFLDDLV